MTEAQSVADMGWDEIGLLYEGMAFASRPLRAATGAVTERFQLGPRGAWILNLIANGKVYPLDIANVFGVGRSLVTAELARLTEAGLVETQQSERDRRRTELRLTPEGEHAQLEIRNELFRMARERLAGFTRQDVLLCSRLLRTFREW